MTLVTILIEQNTRSIFKKRIHTILKVMTEFDRVIRKLKKLGNNRPDPEDHLYNVTQCVENSNMSEEEWCNFYRYITCQDQEEFEYLPRSQITTLGDLGDETLEKIQKQIVYGDKQCVEYFQNGMETTMIVKNIQPIKDKENGKKSVAAACGKLPCRAQGGFPKNCLKSSIKNIQTLRSSSSEDEKEG